MTIRVILAVLFAGVLAAGSLQAGGDPARGKELSVECADCHGANGEGDDETPALAGMDEAEHVTALKGYASGEREDVSGMMADYVTGLSDQDMADIAAYYKTLGGD